MKIGILTYHRSQNYGAFLQAKALQEYVTSLGHNVSIIDYWPDYHDGMYRHFYWSKFRKLTFLSKLSYIFRSLITFFPLRKRRLKTQRNVAKNLNISNDKHYDVVLYGSDQIWRKQYGLTDQFDDVYFGNSYVVSKYKIAYAASMGKMAINTEKDKIFFGRALNRFAAISVRENNLLQLIQKDYKRECTLVCDPVFLLTKRQWQSYINLEFIPKEKYIFYYRLGDLKYTDEIVSDLAKKTKFKVIEVRGYIPLLYIGSRYKMTIDAIEFLSLLSGAEYVITSSFHGLALSIIFEKQFICTCVRSVADRQRTLLNTLGLENRFVEDSTYYGLILNKIDYSEITPRVIEFAKNSKNWIVKQLDNFQDSPLVTHDQSNDSEQQM